MPPNVLKNCLTQNDVCKAGSVGSIRDLMTIITEEPPRLIGISDHSLKRTSHESQHLMNDLENPSEDPTPAGGKCSQRITEKTGVPIIFLAFAVGFAVVGIMMSTLCQVLVSNNQEDLVLTGFNYITQTFSTELDENIFRAISRNYGVRTAFATRNCSFVPNPLEFEELMKQLNVPDTTFVVVQQRVPHAQRQEAEARINSWYMSFPSKERPYTPFFYGFNKDSALIRSPDRVEYLPVTHFHPFGVAIPSFGLGSKAIMLDTYQTSPDPDIVNRTTANIMEKTLVVNIYESATEKSLFFLSISSPIFTNFVVPPLASPARADWTGRISFVLNFPALVNQGRDKFTFLTDVDLVFADVSPVTGKTRVIYADESLHTTYPRGSSIVPSTSSYCIMRTILVGEISFDVYFLISDSYVSSRAGYNSWAFAGVILVTFLALVVLTLIQGRALHSKRKSVRQKMLHLEILQKTIKLAVDAESQVALQSKEVAYVSWILGTVAHELRTPLNLVCGMFQVLTNLMTPQDLGVKTANVQSCMTDIYVGLQSLVSVTNDALTYSSLKSQNLKLRCAPFDIRKDLKKVVMLFKVMDQVSKQVDVSIDFSFSPTHVEQACGDTGRIQQCLHILLSNAVKFTKAGFIKVLVETEVKAVEPSSNSNQEKNCTCKADGHADAILSLVVTVKDSGKGFEKGFKMFTSSMLDSFEASKQNLTRDSGGTGLGLKILEMLICSMGGTAKAVSEGLGCGSIFSFSVVLPCVNPVNSPEQDTFAEFFTKKLANDNNNMPSMLENSSEERSGHPEKFSLPFRVVMDNALTEVNPSPNPGTRRLRATGEELRVLVVDDNAMNRKVVKLLLDGSMPSNIPFNITNACDGDEAVTLIENEPGHGFDVVFMDIEMPICDGFQATTRIRALEDPHKAAIPIYAMTAHPVHIVESKSKETGMTGCMYKPIKKEELVDCMKQAALHVHVPHV